MVKSISKILAFLIVIAPFLEPYMAFGVTLDTLSLLVVILLAMFFCRKQLKGWYNSKPFFIYAFIIPNMVAVAFGYSSHIISSFFVLTLYLLVQLKVFPNVSFEYLKKYYRTLVYISCFVFIAQEVMYQMVGYRFSALLPFLNVRYGMPMATFIQYQMFYPRSSAFFLEPSHMAHFLLPYLAMILGENDKGFSLKKYLEPLFVTIVLFFLQSGCGVVGAFAIWMVFVLGVNISKSKKIIFVAISVLIGGYLIMRLADTEVGASMMNRVSEIDAKGDYERSGTIRIFRGFYVFGGMPFILQLFGVGTGGSIDVIDNSQYLIMFFGTERYLNNIQTLLIGYGIIGTILFGLHFVRLYKDNTLSGRLVLVAFLSICFLESFFMTSKMILFMIIAFLCKINKERKYLNDHFKTV